MLMCWWIDLRQGVFVSCQLLRWYMCYWLLCQWPTSPLSWGTSRWLLRALCDNVPSNCWPRKSALLSEQMLQEVLEHRLANDSREQMLQEVFHCVEHRLANDSREQMLQEVLEHRLANDSREQMLKAHALWCAVDVLGIVQRHWTKVDQMIQHIWFWTFLMNPSIFIWKTKRVICWLVYCRTFGPVRSIGSIFLGGHIRVYEDSRWGFCLNIMWLD